MLLKNWLHFLNSTKCEYEVEWQLQALSTASEEFSRLAYALYKSQAWTRPWRESNFPCPGLNKSLFFCLSYLSSSYLVVPELLHTTAACKWIQGKSAVNFFILEPTQPPLRGYPGLFRWEYSNRDVQLSSHFHLMPRLRMSGAHPPWPLAEHFHSLH